MAAALPAPRWLVALLGLGIAGLVYLAATAPEFPWPLVLLWTLGGLVGAWAAKRRGFSPVVGALGGALLCLPAAFALFLVKVRDPSAPPGPSLALANASALVVFIAPCTYRLGGLGALVGIGLGVAAVILAVRRPAAYGGKSTAAFGILLNAYVLGFILTGPVPAPGPDMMRWRSRTAHQDAALRDVRTAVVRGRSLEPDRQTTDGYERWLVPGRDGSFAYIAAPVERRWYARLDERWWAPPPAFCGDSTGRLCVWSDGQLPRVLESRCPGGTAPTDHGLPDCAR
jgi:hypothetical protein